MPECGSPLWPCAMVGAAACLSGFRDVGVVIHGSSGCYFYPASLLPGPIHSTRILEREVIFGAEARLLEVVGELQGRYRLVAVISTCVPSTLGEDMRGICGGEGVLVVDAPGFGGGFDAGYLKALRALGPKVEPDRGGVNAEGLHPMDPFYRGNLLEAGRLLHSAGVLLATPFCAGSVEGAWHAAPCSVSLNPDLPAPTGAHLGSLLGLESCAGTFGELERRIEGVDPSPVLEEIHTAEERISYACEKYLKREDPPVVAIYATFAYAIAAASMLEEYLDADIAFIGTRNDPGTSRYRVERCDHLEQVEESLRTVAPDLVLGSSYERSLQQGVPFVPLIPPVRGRIQLRARPIAGTEGALSLFDDVLNALMDRKRRSPAL